MKVAIYDLDKTLVRRATFTPFLVFAARRIAPWRVLLAPVWVLMMIGYKLGLTDRTSLKAAGMRVMLGKPPLEKLESVGRAFADHHIEKAGWIASVMALVEQDRADGAEIMIATAAFGFYAKAFAEKLGIDRLVATEWDGISIPGGNCYGEAKKQRVEEAFGGRLPLGPIRFVSDSFADAPLLDCVSHAVFVTGNPKVAAMARARGWKVVAPTG